MSLNRLANRYPSRLITIVFLVFTLFSCIGGFTAVEAQQTAKIAIVLPTVASQVSDADIQYADSIGKRFNRLLNTIGLTADVLDEDALSEAHLKSRLMVVLPLNARITPKTESLLKDFVVSGGKLFVTYNLPGTVASLLGLRQTNWLKQETPGQFASVQLNAPDIPDMPTAIRQGSWNITVAAPTTPQTKIVGYWHSENGDSTHLPALFVGKSGVFFSHVFLADDIQRKTQMLAALLGHLVPEFRQTFAKRAIATMTTVGHTKNFTALAQFVQRSDVPEANRVLNAGADLMKRAHTEYNTGDYNAAVTTARASRAEFSKAYFLSNTSVATEGRAVWNHSGLGAYPGDWNRAAKELAAAGVNMILPNMAWAGVAHYPSEILPQSKTFTQYGDQIAQCVQAAHAHGLEVHVWKITWNLEGAPKAFVEKGRAEGRTQVSATGEALNWLCPSHPKNVLLELGSILEIVTNYDVHGIHLDYIRYPGSHACYCEGCRERFVRTLRKPINAWPAEVLPKTGAYSEQYTEWRVQQITRLVRLIHKRAREVDPDIKISAAVFGWYPGCVTTIGQDWVAWAKAGYLDFVCPMNYTEDAGYFTELLTNQIALMPKNVPIYPGIGATASNSLLTPDAVVEQIYLSRLLGASGWTIFDYAADISETVLPALTLGVAKSKAKPPHVPPHQN